MLHPLLRGDFHLNLAFGCGRVGNTHELLHRTNGVDGGELVSRGRRPWEVSVADLLRVVPWPLRVDFLGKTAQEAKAPALVILAMGTLTSFSLPLYRESTAFRAKLP